MISDVFLLSCCAYDLQDFMLQINSVYSFVIDLLFTGLIYISRLRVTGGGGAKEALRNELLQTAT